MDKATTVYGHGYSHWTMLQPLDNATAYGQCYHKATEMSIYAVGTGLSGSTSVVVTTPTKIYSHISICLIIAIFICDTVKHSQSSQKLITHKYYSITVMTDRTHITVLHHYSHYLRNNLYFCWDGNGNTVDIYTALILNSMTVSMPPGYT